LTVQQGGFDSAGEARLHHEPGILGTAEELAFRRTLQHTNTAFYDHSKWLWIQLSVQVRLKPDTTYVAASTLPTLCVRFVVHRSG